MEQIKEILELKQETNGRNSLHLELTVNDTNVVKYLEVFEEPVRQEKAVEALRVGVIAIQSASPTLDTKIVEEKFREVKSGIDSCVSDFETDIKTHLEEYFKAGSGTIPRSLDTLFGENGKMTQLLNLYFGNDTGKVLKLLQDQLGPSSQFAKSLDPDDKNSVISRLQDAVQLHIQTEASKIVNQFSLDIEDSALSRLNSLVNARIDDIKKSNNYFFSDLKETLGVKTGKAIESEKGTEKGREFELALYYDYVSKLGRSLDDSTELVRGLVGLMERCKKGDYVLTLSNTSAAPGKRIVVEVKKEKNYRLKDAVEELNEAKKNRDADVGIFVFAKGYEPSEVGDFLRLGSDFFVTVDEEALINEYPLLYFDAAYKIQRVLLVSNLRKEEKKEINIEKIKNEIETIISELGKFSELTTKARTISNNSKFIEETVTDLKNNIEPKLNALLNQLNQ